METVSCLMVTKGPFANFLRSYKSYCNQDYPGKELVVITNTDAEYSELVQNHLHNAGRKDVVYVHASPALALGALRNVSLEHASGSLICQWDDDDLFHPRRLSTQLQAMKSVGARVSFLCETFHFFSASRTLYCCNWIRSRHCAGFPGSLLAYKSAVPPYPSALTHHEDAMVQRNIISARTCTAVLTDCGFLYLYTYHGSNTFDLVHHAGLVRAYGYEASTLRERRKDIETWLDGYSLDAPLSVADYLGAEIFRWEGSREGGGEHQDTTKCSPMILSLNKLNVQCR